ncbi:MAG: septal ring lytic transglycosylase RlpA family protein [Glaciimonas sp.]|nr:septal ring lytic transglycosylase RlpA family protein [Glaciimonas sp.]
MLLSASLLWGCSSLPKTAVPASGQSGTAVKQQHTARYPALPAAGSGRGGYYKDDGPGANPPDDLLAIPDADPKVEPYSTRANRPYVVFGQTYTPIIEEVPLRQRGIGSWYGQKFHGQKTSSGELYDMYQMTAAHPTLPIPSYARVTNQVNGNQVIVRINDRGPFHSSRIIDLSYVAALKLGYLGKGSGELEVERLLPADIARIQSEKQSETQLLAKTRPSPIPVAMAAAVPDVNRADNGFYLQLGAYGQAYNAHSMRSQLTKNWAGTLQPIEVVQTGALYRLYSGPYMNRTEAQEAAQKMQSSGAAMPFIVQR